MDPVKYGLGAGLFLENVIDILGSLKSFPCSPFLARRASSMLLNSTNEQNLEGKLSIVSISPNNIKALCNICSLT
ncbi:hypothetical protein HanHA300_Chr11g0414151 [Helianthus annuus]|nr:hypothetical protein HanHA300_Chr11g0414151 [Helianthus annuus]KAJ0518494.1 hypothetical protein HanHA89_Chr11g0438101 [Helianthus annuus]KAJ0686529.1 hypothetical protein HanLR1_Chr11g0415791 [Helianthus annuus]